MYKLQVRASSSYGYLILKAARLSNKLLEQGYVKKRLKSSLRKFYGRYRGYHQTIWSSPVMNVKWHSVAWPYTLTSRHRSDFKLICDLITKLNLLPNFVSFPSNICDGCGMPTGDSYSSAHLVRPIWDLHFLFLLIPILFPNCSLFFQTMHFEHPSVLSRFCFKLSTKQLIDVLSILYQTKR